ncbi:MAG: hypothetical protein LBJ21_08745 [Acidobacteriota bacterium]|nr:hypothetical protein [Acidobacteriota bacterium]
MTGEKLTEFLRRLNAKGYQYETGDNAELWIYRRGQEVAFINEDGEILYKPWSRQHAFHIRDMRDEVDEYMTLYQKAAPVKPSRFRTVPRLLMECGRTELSARERGENGFEFSTWKTVGSHKEDGHFFTNYTAAKLDLAVRAGLIDRDRLFTETELTVIRSNLSDFLTIDGGDHITSEKEQAVRGVIRKIDSVVVPEIREQAQEAEDMGYEPEYEM